MALFFMTSFGGNCRQAIAKIPLGSVEIMIHASNNTKIIKNACACGRRCVVNLQPFVPYRRRLLSLLAKDMDHSERVERIPKLGILVQLPADIDGPLRPIKPFIPRTTDNTEPGGTPQDLRLF